MTDGTERLLAALRGGAERDDGPVRLSAEGANYLEQRAVEVDDLELGPTIEKRAAAQVRRISLLAGMEAVGLLSQPVDPADRVVLVEGRCERVLGYVDAAERLRAYLISADRSALVAEPRSMQVIGGPVSLDWFRLNAPVPVGVHPDAWLARWESAGPDVPGFVVERRDEGGPGPALVRVTPVGLTGLGRTCGVR